MAREIKVTINCDFGGRLAPVDLYLSEPEHGHHPLHFQAEWLLKHRGGIIPAEFMKAIEQLYELSVRYDVSFEQVWVCAMSDDEKDKEQEESDAGNAAPDAEPREMETCEESS